MVRNLHEEGKITKIRKGNLNVVGNKFVENIRESTSKMVERGRRKAEEKKKRDNFIQLLEEIVVFPEEIRQRIDIALNSIKNCWLP